MKLNNLLLYILNNWNDMLITMKLKEKERTVKIWSPEELSERIEKLYLNTLPNVWNMKLTEYHYQIYSVLAVKLCFEVMEQEGTYDFLDTIYLVSESWLISKQRNIRHNYKFKNPYSAFLVFLIELSYKLKRVVKCKRKEVPLHNRFLILALICIKLCLQKPLIHNDEQVYCVLVILRKLASSRDYKMEKIEQMLATNNFILLNEEVIETFHLQINDTIVKLEYNL